MIESMNPKHLKSRTVVVAWLVTASGLIAAGVDLAATWELITPIMQSKINQSLPYLCILLGPLAVHFRVNKKVEL